MYGTVQTEADGDFSPDGAGSFSAGEVCSCSATSPETTPAPPRRIFLVYLERNGIEVQQETIRGESGLSARREDLADQILPDSEWPAQGLPDNCEVQPAREPATLLMDFVRGLSELGQTCETIHGIQEGYWYSGEEDRAVLTPMWEIETDQGTFLLDCAQGLLTRAT